MTIDKLISLLKALRKESGPCDVAIEQYNPLDDEFLLMDVTQLSIAIGEQGENLIMKRIPSGF